MSNQENKMKEELARLQRDKAQVEKLTPVSTSCADLIKFMQDTPEPMSPEYDGENQWVAKVKKGMCEIL